MQQGNLDGLVAAQDVCGVAVTRVGEVKAQAARMAWTPRNAISRAQR